MNYFIIYNYLCTCRKVTRKCSYHRHISGDIHVNRNHKARAKDMVKSIFPNDYGQAIETIQAG